MVIDIIDLNDPKYADLTSLQMSMVRTAQAQKDEVLSKAEKKKTERLIALLDRNIARSSMREREAAEIDAAAESEIAVIREDLLYRLAYEELYADGNEQGAYRYPENPNYNLSYPQRFLAVRDYYMHVTTEPNARLKAFSMDTLARSYLGDYYQTLYDLLASYC